MSSDIETLQDIHTATNDVLKGYREMSARAQADIAPVVSRLVALHERHADEQAALLAGSPEAEIGDTSLQGAVNKAVVVMRDWLSDLDRDALPAVRKGEEALREKYADALKELDTSAQAPIAALLRSQMSAVEGAIADLPRA
jgi:hypothetical protein